MPAPVVAGAIALASNKNFLGFLKGGLGSITGAYHQDNNFIDYRDDVARVQLPRYGIPEKSATDLYVKYDIHHAGVQDRGVGSVESLYGPEYEGLHQLVRELVNQKQPGLGDRFVVISKELGKSRKDGEAFKGNIPEALAMVFSNGNISMPGIESIPVVKSGSWISLPGGNVGINGMSVPASLISSGDADTLLKTLVSDNKLSNTPGAMEPGFWYNVKVWFADAMNFKTYKPYLLIVCGAGLAYVIYKLFFARRKWRLFR